LVTKVVRLDAYLQPFVSIAQEENEKKTALNPVFPGGVRPTQA
jgi:hypothetical protein